LPSIVREQKVLGPFDWVANLRGQLALVVGLVRNWRSLRSSPVIVIEGGLLASTFVLTLLNRRRSSQVFVFDLITLMSSLHRDRGPTCSVSCKLRRAIWRGLELVCVRSADVSIAGSQEDVSRLRTSRAMIVPHIVLVDGMEGESREDGNLIGFLGNGHVVPNREALDFIASNVLNHPSLKSVRCRVIGDREGYDQQANQRIEFVGFHKNPSSCLSTVSVCCAPMQGAGGVSTKVLSYLLSGKRTVSTPEAAHGIGLPPNGLWVAERDKFPETVAAALTFPWSPARAASLRNWMESHHGLPALAGAWDKLLRSMRHVPDNG